MNIRCAAVDDLPDAAETVVVIDVIRAFTTAAFAFAAGADRIIPVRTVDEALALGDALPDALVMGHEADGMPPEGFDFGNSPAELVGQDLRGKQIVSGQVPGQRGLFWARRICSPAALSVQKRPHGT